MKNTKPKKISGMTLLELIVVILVLLSIISIIFFGAKAWKEKNDAVLAKAAAREKERIEEYSVVFEKTEAINTLPVSITVKKRLAKPPYKIDILVSNPPNKISASTNPLYLAEDKGRPILETEATLSTLTVTVNDEWVSFNVSEHEPNLLILDKTRVADIHSFKKVAELNKQHLIEVLEDILGPKEKVVATEMFLAE